VGSSFLLSSSADDVGDNVVGGGVVVVDDKDLQDVDDNVVVDETNMGVGKKDVP
jgi:hypothetical protein